MNLEKRIEQKISEFVESDIIEKKIEESLSKAVDNALDSMTGGWGEITRIIESKVKETLVPMIEKHDYSQFALKLDVVLADILRQATLPTDTILRRFKQVTAKTPKLVDIEDVFDKYREHVSKNIDTSDLEIDYDDEPNYGYADVEVELVEDRDRYSWSETDFYILQFRCEEDELMNFDLRAMRIDDNTLMISHMDLSETKLSSISTMSEFELYLISLKLNHSQIMVDDMDIHLHDEADIEERPYD